MWRWVSINCGMWCTVIWRRVHMMTSVFTLYLVLFHLLSYPLACIFIAFIRIVSRFPFSLHFQVLGESRTFGSNSWRNDDVLVQRDHPRCFKEYRGMFPGQNAQFLGSKTCQYQLRRIGEETEVQRKQGARLPPTG